MAWSLIIDWLLEYSQSLSVVALGLYLAYETRLGVIAEVRDDLRTVGVAVYKILKRDEHLDEQAFREALWDDGDEVLISDLNKGD